MGASSKGLAVCLAALLGGSAICSFCLPEAPGVSHSHATMTGIYLSLHLDSLRGEEAVVMEGGRAESEDSFDSNPAGSVID